MSPLIAFEEYLDFATSRFDCSYYLPVQTGQCEAVSDVSVDSRVSSEILSAAPGKQCGSNISSIHQMQPVAM